MTNLLRFPTELTRMSKRQLIMEALEECGCSECLDARDDLLGANSHKYLTECTFEPVGEYDE